MKAGAYLRVWRPPTFGKGPTAPSCGKGRPTGRGAGRGAEGDHPPSPTNPARSQRPRRPKQRTTIKNRNKTAALAGRLLGEAYSKDSTLTEEDRHRLLLAGQRLFACAYSDF